MHGHSNVIGAVVFPHNIGLGATRNAELVEEIARITAKEIKATGINWDFAPSVAVPRDDRWGRTYEGFAEEPKLVAELGAAAVRGLQGNHPGDAERVVACAKHLAGDGGTVLGSGVTLPDGVTYPFDRGDVPLSEEEVPEQYFSQTVIYGACSVSTGISARADWEAGKVLKILRT